MKKKKWMQTLWPRLKQTAPYWVTGSVLLIACTVFTIRLVDWQLVNGASYADKAIKSNISTVKMEAARGEILDDKGNYLAKNKTVYNLVFERATMTEDTENTTIDTLIKLLNGKNEAWIDNLPIVIDSNGQYAFVEDKENEIAKLKGKDFLNLNSYASADLCMKQLMKKYDLEESSYSMEEVRNIISVRYSMTLAEFRISIPYTFAEDVSAETVAIIKENSKNLPGVTSRVSTAREYPDGTIAPHIIGSMGTISQEEYDELKDKGYAYNDRLGKNGIEGTFEEQLRGTAGSQVIQTDGEGNVASSTVKQNPVPGNSVFTTLDSNLQRVANSSLAKNVKAARDAGIAATKDGKKKNKGEDAVAGGLVVLRIKDFAVLAAATFPSYDLGLSTTDSDYYSSLLKDETRPLFNRAFNGAFMPGSSFKPAVAAAALQEGIVTANDTVYCGGIYTYYPDYRPKCLGVHQETSLIKALEKSCNVYFYDVGRRLGIKYIDTYAQSFGLGVKTGIELNESEGRLASPENRTAAGGTWNPGDVIQAAIGQADNAFTPLQLATYVATIANNGTRLQSHLISKITDYNQKTVLMENDPDNPKVVETVGVSQENLNLVKQGMRAVCVSGTASSVFGNYGIAVAGKTGTAENPPHSDNVVFVGYAPYDNPEIAVAVVIEYGSASRYPLNIAKDIFDAYFYGKTTDDRGNITMPSVADSMNGLTVGAQAVTD